MKFQIADDSTSIRVRDRKEDKGNHSSNKIKATTAKLRLDN